jgi:hypothetical protein
MASSGHAGWKVNRRLSNEPKWQVGGKVGPWMGEAGLLEMRETPWLG